jgi:hypothetical protein
LKAKAQKKKAPLKAKVVSLRIKIDPYGFYILFVECFGDFVIDKNKRKKNKEETPSSNGVV